MVLAKPYVHVPVIRTLAQNPGDVWTEYVCTANEEPLYMQKMDPRQRQEIEGGAGGPARGHGGRGGCVKGRASERPGLPCRPDARPLRLELILQPELHDAPMVQVSRYLSERLAAQGRVRILRPQPVERIERLNARLETVRVGEPE